VDVHYLQPQSAAEPAVLTAPPVQGTTGFVQRARQQAVRLASLGIVLAVTFGAQAYFALKLQSANPMKRAAPPDPVSSAKCTEVARLEHAIYESDERAAFAACLDKYAASPVPRQR